MTDNFGDLQGDMRELKIAAENARFVKIFFDYAQFDYNDDKTDQEFIKDLRSMFKVWKKNFTP